MKINVAKTEVTLTRTGGGYKTIQCAVLKNGNIQVLFVNNEAVKQVQMVLRGYVSGQETFLNTDLRSEYDHAPLYVIPAQVNGKWAIFDPKLC
jgi:hypothetical protein